MFDSNNDGLYVEKYRPSTLEGYVGNQHIIEKCKIWLEQGEIPHILLYGSAGTGKCLSFNEEINIKKDLS